MLSPPRREADRADDGFAEEGFVSSVGGAAAAAAVGSEDSDWSAVAREVRFWFVGMRLDCVKGLRVSFSLAARMRESHPLDV